MDRRSFAVCAVILASGAIIGCDAQSVQPVAPALVPSSAWTTREADVPQIVELHGETAVPPAAPLAEETHPPAASIDLARVQEAELGSALTDDAHGNAVDDRLALAQGERLKQTNAIEPDTGTTNEVSSGGEPQVEFVVVAPTQEVKPGLTPSNASSSARSDSRLTSEIITAKPFDGPKTASSPTAKKPGSGHPTKAGKKLAVQKPPAGKRAPTASSNQDFPKQQASNNALPGETTKHDSLKLDVAEDAAPNRLLIKEDTRPEEVAAQEKPELSTAQSPTPLAPAAKRSLTSVSITPVFTPPPAEVAKPQAETSTSRVAKQEVPKRETKSVEAAPVEAPKLAAPTPAPPSVQPPQPSIAKQEAPKREMTPVEIAPIEAPKLAVPTVPTPRPRTSALQPAPSSIAQQAEPKNGAAPVEHAPREVPKPEIAKPQPRPSGTPEPQIAKQEIPKREIPLITTAPRAIAETEPLRGNLAGRDDPASRLPEMIAAVSQAEQRVAHGFQLAQRGAIYLARAEFTAALKLIAQANDVELGTRAASKAVTASLIALKESSDFVRQSAGPDDVDLARIVAGHKTQLLKSVDVSDMPPPIAADRYQVYAQEHLSAAIGHEMVGSMALYGLGRAVIVGAGASSKQLEYTGPAMAFYQAALAVEPRNFRAANELGVLMANHGQLNLAKDMLTRSATLAPNATTWRNLATVHNRMGDSKLAEQLQAEAKEMKQAGPNPGAPAVQWVDPATFASAVPATDGTIPPSAAPAQQPAPFKPVVEPAKPPSNIAKRFNDWLPPNLRR